MKRNEGTVYTIEIHTTRFRMQTNELKGQKLDQNSVQMNLDRGIFLTQVTKFYIYLY